MGEEILEKMIFNLKGNFWFMVTTHPPPLLCQYVSFCLTPTITNVSTSQYLVYPHPPPHTLT